MEVGVKESFKKTFTRSSSKWAGHVGRMRDDNQAKRADVQKVTQECQEKNVNNVYTARWITREAECGVPTLSKLCV